MVDIQTLVLILLVILNGVTFCMFGADKWLAHGHSWRISEKMLWSLALVGGSAGALLGMYLFRHKTRKLTFQLVMFLIIALQVAIFVGVFIL